MTFFIVEIQNYFNQSIYSYEFFRFMRRFKKFLRRIKLQKALKISPFQKLKHKKRATWGNRSFIIYSFKESIT